MNILLAVLALNLLIILHELGHFLVGKRAGVDVLEFSLFFGPRLFKVTRRGTTYSLRLIPVGAYVLFAGEEEEVESEGSFTKKSLPVRAAVIAAGPVMNLLTALVLLCLVFTFAGYGTTRIDSVTEGSPAELAGLQPGDEIIKYGGKRVYQPSDYMSFLMVGRGKTAEMEIVRAGQRMRTTLTPQVIPGDRYILGFVSQAPYGPESTVIRSVMPDSPAAQGGLESGDRLIRLDGKEINSKEEVSAYLAESRGKPVKVTFIRDGAERSSTLTPILEEGETVYAVGLGFANERGALLQVIKQAVIYTYSTMRNVVYTVGWLLTGEVSLTELMGPVRIVSTISNVVEESSSFRQVLIDLLNIMAFISIALGGTNLLPFPALDGGRLLTLGISALIRRPIPPQKEAVVSMVGLALLMMLGVFTIFNDLIQLIFG